MGDAKMVKRAVLLGVILLLAGCWFRATPVAVPEYVKKNQAGGFDAR